MLLCSLSWKTGGDVHIIVEICGVDFQLFLVDISDVRDGGAQVCSLQKIYTAVLYMI